MTRDDATTSRAVASTGSALDGPLARQLVALRAEAGGAADPSTSLRPALVESALWCLGAAAAWVVVAWLV